MGARSSPQGEVAPLAIRKMADQSRDIGEDIKPPILLFELLQRSAPSELDPREKIL